SLSHSLSLSLYRHGFAKSNSEYGVLTDNPDWSFADGRSAPPLKGQIRRQREAEETAARVLLLSREMERGREKWERQKDLNEQIKEEKRATELQRKGNKGRETSISGNSSQ
uniref:Large ribosomal subunit protein mL52 n=1 Tax=Callorhinchus milii TaxID=7868 RepID=A0A4W3GNA7_CALMI